MGSSYLNPPPSTSRFLRFGVFDVCVCVGLARRRTGLPYYSRQKKTNHMASHWDSCPYSLSISQVQLDETTVSPKNNGNKKNLGKSTMLYTTSGCFLGDRNLFYKPIFCSGRWIIYENPLRLSPCQGLQLLGEDMLKWCDFFVGWPNIEM